MSVRTAESHREGSPVSDHAKSIRHNTKEYVKILNKDSSWFERGVREAAHIKMRRSSLNRDRGRYHLPTIY